MQLVGHELLLSPEAEVGVRLLFQSQLLSVHGARELAPQLLRHQAQLLELNSLQLNESILVFVPLKQVVAVTQFIPQKADLFRLQLHSVLGLVQLSLQRPLVAETLVQLVLQLSHSQPDLVQIVGQSLS